MSPNFYYKSKTATGEDRDGEMEALNEKDATKELQAQGLYVTSISTDSAMGNKEYKVSMRCIIWTTITQMMMGFVFLSAINFIIVICLQICGVIVNDFYNISIVPILIPTICETILIGIYHIYWCKSFIFTVGKDKVTVQGGILRRNYSTTPYKEIINVSILQGFEEQIANYKNVEIQPAGTSLAKIVFFGVAEANEIKDLILGKISRTKK